MRTFVLACAMSSMIVCSAFGQETDGLETFLTASDASARAELAPSEPARPLPTAESPANPSHDWRHSVEAELSAIREDVNALGENVTHLNQSVGALQSDVGTLKQQTAENKEILLGIESLVADVREDVKSLRTDLRGTRYRIEDWDTQTKEKASVQIVHHQKGEMKAYRAKFKDTVKFLDEDGYVIPAYAITSTGGTQPTNRVAASSTTTHQRVVQQPQQVYHRPVQHQAYQPQYVQHQQPRSQGFGRRFR